MCDGNEKMVADYDTPIRSCSNIFDCNGFLLFLQTFVTVMLIIIIPTVKVINCLYSFAERKKNVVYYYRILIPNYNKSTVSLVLTLHPMYKTALYNCHCVLVRLYQFIT